MKLKLTGWYPSEIKPVRAGLYQVFAYDSEACWAWWDGGAWGLACFSKVDAVKSVFSRHPYAVQSKMWRGVKCGSLKKK